MDRFAKRIRWPLVLREVEERRRVSPDMRRKLEGDLLQKTCPSGAIRIVLDERGEILTSLNLAHRIGRWRDTGQDLAFMIGGADGLAKPVRDKADLLLAFGSATWPHRLVRVMLMEQLYRAQETLAGNPYPRN